VDLYNDCKNIGKQESVQDPATSSEDQGGDLDNSEIDTDVNDFVDLSPPRPERMENVNALDNWTRQRIQQAIIASRTRVQSKKGLLRTPKLKPPIEENPVFWRIVKSPTGFEVEEGDNSSCKSDNMVLRVDETIAGGPILDQATRQKASGGTWRLLGGDSREMMTARLRFRLVIPPRKERILVMEGPIKCISMTSSGLPLASSTFRIPALEERASQAAASAAASQDMEDLTHCGGEVWIEDAVSGNNRDDIGTLLMTKLNTPTDPAEYVITIPKPGLMSK
jgi:hypothetical protein